MAKALMKRVGQELIGQRSMGGLGLLLQRYLFDLEMAQAGTPGIIPFGLSMVAPVIMKFGTSEQNENICLIYWLVTSGGVRDIPNQGQGPILHL